MRPWRLGFQLAALNRAGNCPDRRPFDSGQLERQASQMYGPRLDMRQNKPLEGTRNRFSVN